MFRLLLILIFISITKINFSTTYYIDASDGNDSFSGKTISQAWQTINKINTSSFSSGDSILLKCGQLWREQLTIPSSGIIIGNYGSGSNPKILGSIRPSVWTQYSHNIWKTNLSSSPMWIWFISDGDTLAGNKKTDIPTLTSLYDFNFSSNYLYIYTNTDPNQGTFAVEAAIRDNGIYGYRKDNVSINGITISFTKKSAIYLGPGNYWNISDVIGCFSGDYNNESPGDGILCYGSNNKIKNSTFYQNAHAGINIYDVAGNSIGNIIEHNVIYNNYHNNLDIKTLNVGNVENCTVRYNKIYCTDDFTRSDVAGIFLQGNTSTNVNGINIYYNIVYNQTGSGIHLSTNTSNISIYNNTVYKTRGDNTACYYLYNGSGVVILKNNIGMNAKAWSVRLETGTSKIINYNCWYQEPGQSQSIARIGSNSYSTWNNYQLATGFDINSLWGIDPLFFSLAQNDFSLNTNSPCKQKGEYVNIDNDFIGNPIIGSPEIGAFEILLNRKEGNIKIFLQGAYSNGTMTTSLNSSELLPLMQPYNTSPYNYSGDESVFSIPSNIVDWIFVELRDGNLPSSIVAARRAGFIRSDGQIVDLDGVSRLGFDNLTEGSYYIVVKHRNHLSIMSSNPVLFSDSVSYDFSSDVNKAYGQNAMIDLGDGKFGMIAGDSDGNGMVNVSDYTITGNNIFMNGYMNGDLDMNGCDNILDYVITFKSIFTASRVP